MAVVVAGVAVIVVVFGTIVSVVVIIVVVTVVVFAVAAAVFVVVAVVVFAVAVFNLNIVVVLFKAIAMEKGKHFKNTITVQRINIIESVKSFCHDFHHFAIHCNKEILRGAFTRQTC